VHLSGLAELTKVVTEDNVHEWLDRAEGLTLKRIKALVRATQEIEERPTKKRATIRPIGVETPQEPKPAQPSLFDTPPAPPDPTPPKAPEAAHPPAPPVPPTPPTPEPAPAPSPKPPEESELRRLVYRLSILVGQEFCTLLDEAKALLSHAIPDGDVEKVLIRALERLIAEVKKERFGVGKTKGKGKKKGGKLKPSAPSEAAKPERSRHIPDAIKSEVHDRDGARCAYVAPDGTACESDRFIQHHHIHPFAKGGAHTPENITHYCHTHNALAARQDYGAEKAESWRKDRNTKSPHLG
jgi:hypothetical protein